MSESTPSIGNHYYYYFFMLYVCVFTFYKFRWLIMQMRHLENVIWLTTMSDNKNSRMAVCLNVSLSSCYIYTYIPAYPSTFPSFYLGNRFELDLLIRVIEIWVINVTSTRPITILSILCVCVCFMNWGSIIWKKNNNNDL